MCYRNAYGEIVIVDNVLCSLNIVADSTVGLFRRFIFLSVSELEKYLYACISLVCLKHIRL